MLKGGRSNVPIFDYRCTTCGHRFEELVTRAEDAVTCTKCSAPATKLLSAFAAHAAGSGSPASLPGGGACACHPGGGGCGGFDD